MDIKALRAAEWDVVSAITCLVRLAMIKLSDEQFEAWRSRNIGLLREAERLWREVNLTDEEWLPPAVSSAPHEG